MASKFTITAELNLQTKNLGQTVNNLKQQFKGMDVNIKVKDLAAAESSIRNISKEAKSASQSMGLLGSSIGMAFKRFAAVTLATGTIVGFTRAIKSAVSDAISFEREIVKIAQATGKTVAQLRALSNEVGDVATKFGVSSKELLDAARSLTQAGFAADKVTGALKLLAQTELAATFDSIGDTTEGVIALLNQFGRTAQRTGTEIDFLEKSLSAINQVSKEFAVESSDLITVIRTTGSAFESAGGSLDELLALFTSVRATTRESAESIATGFRTIFTRVQRVDTINALRDLGIELQDAEGKFVGPMEAAKRLSVALSTIDPKDFRFNMVVEELGGFRQVSKVIPLIQQFGVAQKALNVAQGSSGSLAKDAQTAQQSLAVQIQKTREEFLRFVRDLTESSSFQNTAKFLLDVANAFIRVADTMKPLIPLIASFGALKIGQAFLPSIKAVTGLKKAQGGKIHAFASGGLVPGQGNGDTVHAMLSPGEFVIKKSSVKSLGADNLAGMNKYGLGGVAKYKEGTGEKGASPRDLSTVRQNIKATKLSSAADVAKQSIEDTGGKTPLQIGGAFLRPAGFNVDKTEFLPTGDLEIAKLNSDPIFGPKLDKAYSKSKKGLFYNLNLRSLSTQKSSQVEDSILKNVVNAVDESADILAGSIGEKASDTNLGQILKKANIDQVSGNIFEAMLLNMGAPFDSAEPSSTSFDFRKGLGANIAGNFVDAENLVGNPTDARNSVTTSSIGGFKGKVDGFLQEEIAKFKTKELQENASTGLAGFGSQATTFDSIKGSDTVQALTGLTSKATVAQMREALSAKGYDLIQSGAKGKYTISKRFADGGLGSGTDTVPAMLTPGEFVINKKSAESIGYSSLNKMNKVGKFAKGGPVKHFAGGGQATFDQGQQQMQKALFIPQIQPLVSPGQLKTIEKIVDDYIKDNKDAEAVMKAIVRDLQNQKKQTGQVKIGKPLIERAERAATRNNTLENKKAGPPKDPEMPKLSDKLKALGDSTDNTSTKFLIMAGVAESVVSQMSGLSEEVKNAASAFGATFATYMAIGSSLKDLGINIAASIAQKREERIAAKAEQAAREAQNAAIKRNSAAFDAHSAKLNGKGGGGLDAGGKAAGGGKLAKGMAIFDGALMGFSVAMGIAAAATEYYATLARKAGKELDETVAKFKKDATSVSENQLSDKFSKALTASGKADSLARNTQSTGGMAVVGGAALGGAAAGAAIGSIFPVIGTAIGAVVGGIVGALGGLAAVFLKSYVDFNGAFANIQKSANNLSSSLYESVTATVKARKFLEKIDTKNTQDIFSELNSTTNSYVSSLDKAVAGEAAAIAAFGSMEKVPEQFKKSIDEVKQSANELKQELDRIVAANTGRKVKELSDKIGNTKFDVVKDITSFVDSQQQNISKSTFSETKGQYSGRFAELQAKGANTSGLETKVMQLSVVKAAHAAEELKLSLLEASLQIVAQKEAMLKEREIREKLIGTLIQQEAFDSAFDNLKFSLEKTANEINSISALYSGSASGLKSKTVDSSILDVRGPMGENAKDFDRAMATISSIGPVGQKVASNLADINKVMPKFKIALQSTDKIDFAKMMSMDEKESKGAVDKFISDLGLNVNSGVAEAMRESFKVARDPQGEKLDPTSQAEKVYENFKKMADASTENGKKILDAFKAAEANERAIIDQITESRMRQGELELSNADAYEALQKNIAQARGRSMSLAEGDQLRGNRQSILAGKLGGNPKAIGAELKRVTDEIKKSGPTSDLMTKQKKLTKALDELANQSNRTSDIMSKMEEAKAKRETARDFAKDFVFGTNEQRDTMQKDISNARTAAQQGNLSSVAEEDRAGVGAMFERFKDLPIFNGMTGRQAQNKVIANEVRASGGGEQMARMIEQDMSSPEEKLIQELKNTAASEQAAREELFNRESSMQDELEIALAENTTALKATLSANLAQAEAEKEAAKKKMEENQGKAPEADALAEQRKKLEAEIILTKDNITKLAGSITNLTSAIDSAIVQMYKDIENRGVSEKAAREAIALQKTEPRTSETGGGMINMTPRAKGGPIYLANGGDVFKSKGTDTVPIMATPGEYMIQKSSADKYGSGFLGQLNQGKVAVGYSSGGYIEAKRERGVGRGMSLGLGKSNKELDYEEAKKERGVGRGMSLGLASRPKPKAPNPFDQPEKRSTFGQRAYEAVYGSEPKPEGFQGTIRQTVANRLARRNGMPNNNAVALQNIRKRQEREGVNLPPAAPVGLGGGQREVAQAAAVQQAPMARPVPPPGQGVAAAAPAGAAAPQAAAPKMMDEGIFARSVESLNTIASTFSSFTETLQGLVSQFAGITVKHTMTVDGNLAITGVDPATIGKTIADALMKSIGDETLKQIQTKQDQKQGPMR